MENKERVQIAKALIAFILMKSRTASMQKIFIHFQEILFAQFTFRLLKDDFEQLSQSITEIFPSEVKETYYIPFRKDIYPKESCTMHTTIYEVNLALPA